jgi:hypothetical protein
LPPLEPPVLDPTHTAEMMQKKISMKLPTYILAVEEMIQLMFVDWIPYIPVSLEGMDLNDCIP